MARRYHTLLTRTDGRWGIEFGDWDREVVVEEMLDSYAADFKAKDRKIIATSGKQADINAAVAALNIKAEGAPQSAITKALHLAAAREA